MQNTRRPGTGRGPGRPPKRGRKGGRMTGVGRPPSRASNTDGNHNTKGNNNINDNDNNNNKNDNHDNHSNGNVSGVKSRSPSITTSASSITPSPSSIVARQLRHSTSQKVDYNLKKRKIIPSEDFTRTKRKYNKSNGNGFEQQNAQKEEQDQHDPIQDKELIERDAKGKIVHMNEPSTLRDTLNGATGLPLGQGPPEKVKKEYMWSYKKNSFIGIPNDEMDEIELPRLESSSSELLSNLSDIRHEVRPVDIYADQRDVLIQKNEVPKKIYEHQGMGHIKVKATVSEESKSKLFGQNSVANLPGSGAYGNLAGTTQEIENDDFCSACLQSGSFLCCDTCPKSFHFLCLNPPLDPDKLPDGDWSCPQCFFKMRFSNASQIKKAEKDYIQERVPRECKLFGKLLFQLEITNPRQFSLPQSLKETFQNVRSGPHGVYNDGREKEPLSEKQLFGAPYGQSLNMLDRYNPDIHVDQETGKFLTCYKCKATKMGTWDSPEESRLIMRCDYCKTPWHLDCVPHAPRASFKNLGTKWKCPLHAPNVSPVSGRRLTKSQKFIEPIQSCGFKNNGAVEIVLDEITSPGSKAMIDAEKRVGDFPPVALLSENSVKLDFMDKVYRAKKVQRERDYKYQEKLIDKLLTMSSRYPPSEPIEDLMSFIYFQVSNNPSLKKLWDFKELCNVAEHELHKESITAQELNDLLLIKKLLESKPKEEITSFLNLGK
ncbi:RCO1 (YMR075W) [Zygosaccharomyces parabailii]|uniref:ZYBA0S05-05622g1_1 n=1 Tax=Zygosaccharomyces bailii (strain CLIB 213 / ATCC 58445 / CBS 680 / BCRC 21525 / NBRC 1098 / NCYC 1416 / NRRL Y-2227) TaxID=1333698 RepID=A0A8J2XB46_ZYGB2|nr:RCO1 (YMR075W) [Zygosaccharomyces parabailii]CDF89957.1 ZYBA0S05-05622g1_1 [Zygosaccharomyces bailii CLIB 213]